MKLLVVIITVRCRHCVSLCITVYHGVSLCMNSLGSVWDRHFYAE